ncbi:MAG TPA: metallopeptidase family protein [Candidatus Paceibacterota bacterium]|nr:metallopeptidase family protein [Candidatus Paceibacterota bacterium]
MPREEFEKLVAEEFEGAIPEEFRPKIHNVAFLIEDEPSKEDREREGLHPHETLLGLYKGVPHTARGDFYGMGATLPDTITLYQLPIEDEAAELNVPIRRVIRETIWHELAHHFGMDESAVRRREDELGHEV